MEEAIRILVVDDEPDIRRICRILLETGGYTVLEAATGAEAVERKRVVRHGGRGGGPGEIARQVVEVLGGEDAGLVFESLVEAQVGTPAGDEAAVLQLPQMVGGGGAAHTHQRRQIHDALLTVAQ